MGTTLCFLVAAGPDPVRHIAKPVSAARAAGFLRASRPPSKRISHEALTRLRTKPFTDHLAYS